MGNFGGMLVGDKANLYLVPKVENKLIMNRLPQLLFAIGLTN